MKSLAGCVALACLLLPASALADGWTYAQTQGDDDAFHISVAGSYSEQGQPPRNHNFGVGTIKVSLPHISAQYEPGAATDVPGYNCLKTFSAYGEPDTGFLCSTDGTPQAGGTAFPTAVRMGLVSPNCYAPPAQGDPQPALVEVWAAPYDPGTAPDVSFPLYGDRSCNDDSVLQPVLEDRLKCVVPNVKSRRLSSAVGRLTHNNCKRGRVTLVFSSKVDKGRVISQSVKAGKTLPKGTKVNLVVSKGPRKT